MAGWLQKILTPPAQTGSGRKLPVQARGNANLPGQPNRPVTPGQGGLPNATVIYGIGASLMFVAALFLLLKGRWLPGLVVLALGACLMGFAMHLLKHQD